MRAAPAGMHAGRPGIARCDLLPAPWAGFSGFDRRQQSWAYGTARRSTVARPAGAGLGGPPAAPGLAGRRGLSAQSRPTMESASIRLEAGPLRLELDTAGRVVGLRVRGVPRGGPEGVAWPLVRLAGPDGVRAPSGARLDAAAGVLHFAFGADAGVWVEVLSRTTHLTLRVARVIGAGGRLLLWGPVPTGVGAVVGETVGVVRDGGAGRDGTPPRLPVAIGLQALSPDTLGGWPAAHAPAGCPDAAGRAGAREPYEECAAWRTAWGSVLQAHAPDPSRSAIALFACPEPEALAVLGAIELAEGLPHPLLGGVWAKVSPEATRSYLICGFRENDLDAALECTARAGLRYLYHPDPFASWGHYRPHEGDAALRRCCERATARGIGLGVHTLSNFISRSDGYVTPRPDPRLQRAVHGRLAAAVGAEAAELPVEDAAPFRERGWCATVLVGDELVRYAAAEDDPPRLAGCERGAHGTGAASHAAGAEVGRLADHAYRVFFPDSDLQDEIAGRLAELFRSTGLRQISFDGLEGCREAGGGAAAEARFVLGAARGWPEGGEVINDASRLSHFTWHVHTRMNWGEPWGRAMREGQTEYRFANQDYFERNLFPRMLGWFRLHLDAPGHPATSLDDIEWMLARAAGYGAGFGLVSDLATLRGHGDAGAMLEAVRLWEAARHADAFTADQRARLRAGGEWHLEAAGDGAWGLRPVWLSPALVCRAGEGQPGHPGGGDWPVVNPHPAQAPQVRLTAMGGTLTDPGLQLGGRTVMFRCRLEAGQVLRCGGGLPAGAAVCDANGNVVRPVVAEGGGAVLAPGAQTVSLSAEFSAGAGAELRLATWGAPEAVATGR